MECTLAALIACFSWSNLYIDTGVAYRDLGEHFIYTDRGAILTEKGELLLLADERTIVNSEARNLYGNLEIGFELRFYRITWTLAVSHESSLQTDKDSGINAIRLNARWFPFRQK